MSLILKQEANANVTTPPAGSGSVFLNGSDQLTIKDSAGNISTVPTFTPTGNSSVFYNDNGALGQSGNFTFDDSTNTLAVLGNVNATGVVTNNLYYANGNPWDLQQPAGSNTYIQFNNNDSFGASANLTFDGNNLNTVANLNVTGNTYISGNLTVDGNVVYVNVESLSVEDPLIALGGGANGAPLTSNNGYDRGLILHNYTTQAVDAFMGWDTSNAEFTFASNANVTNDVVTINQLGNVRANNIAGTLSTQAQPNITSVGTLTGLLIGATALQADFPNATVIASQDNSGQTHSENIGIVGEAVADSGNTSTWGIGVLGEARANGDTKATGVQGGGYVTSSTDAGAAVGVRGYSIQTHSGGYNIGVLGNAQNSGLGSYAFYVQAGDIGSIETETDWDLYDNSHTALTFRSSGKANIFGIDTTDSGEGIYTEGYLNVTGNASVGGVLTDNYYYANGSPVDFQQAGGANTQIQFNDADSFGGSAALTFNKTSNLVSMGGALSVTGNANVGNLGTAGLIAATGNISGGNLTSNGNITASSAATVTFGDNTTLYSGYTTMNPAGIFHNTTTGPSTLQVATDSLANGIAIWTNGVANSFIQSTGGIEFIVGSTLRSNLNPTGGTTEVSITANGLYVADNIEGNSINSSSTINSIGNTSAGNFTTSGIVNATGNVNGGNVNSSGKITALGNIIGLGSALVENQLYVGNNSANISLTNPVIIASSTGEEYVQAALINKNSNGSADWTSYGDNGNTIAGWSDMGFTGSTFNDANYTITGSNDGYFFVQAVNGLGLGGNLVFATGDQGANNDIVFATGGFLAANEKMRFVSAEGAFKIKTTTAATNTTTGALVVSGGVGVAGNVYSGGVVVVTGNVSGGNLVTAGTANVGNLNVTGNVTSALLPNANVTYDLGSDTQRWKDLYLANSTIYLGNANIKANGTSIAMSGNLSGSNISTGGTLSVTGNANVGNLGTAGLIVATGNVTGGNITTGGVVAATGNVTGGNLNTSGNVNASIIVAGGTGMYLSAGPSGYINFFTTGGDKASISDTGNITGSNVIANSTVFAGTANVSGNVNAGNIITGGTVSATGNGTFGNVSATTFTGALSGAATTAGTVTTAAQPNITSVGTLTTVSVSGNANVGNLGTAGLLVATGNVTGGNLVTGGLVNATGNLVTSANVVTDLIVGKTTGVSITATGTNQNINLTPTGTGTVNVGNFIISNVQTPVNDYDAATKKYVDDVSQGLNIHDSCQAATPTTLATITGGTITYNNGASGVGANLTTTGSFNLIDGVNVQTSGTRILVKNEANAVYNGIYTWSNATVITRATDFNSVPEVEAGDFVFVTGGTLYDNTGWVQINSPAGIGGASDVIEFTQFSGAGTYTAGTGLTLSGSQFSITNTTVSAGAYGNGDYNATFTVNSQGQLTAAANVAITANAANLSGTTLKSTVVNSSLTSVGTLTTLSVSGNANVGNIGAAAGVFTTVAGSLTTAAQPNITSVGTLTSLGVNGTVTAVAFTANTGVFTGNGSGLSAIAGANVTGTVSSATTAGTVTTAAQGNITSVGTLTSLGVSGNITAANITANTGIFSGNGSALTALNASNISTGTLAQARLANASVTLGSTALTLGSTVTTVAGLSSVTSTTFVGALTGAATTAGTVTTAAQPNITSVGTLTSLGVSGSVTASTLVSNVATGTAPFTVTSTTQVANLNVATAGVAGYVTAAAQSNITSVGTLSSLAVTGNITAGNITATHYGSGAALTDINASNISSGTLPSGRLSGSYSISVSSATSATTSGTVTTAAQPNITSIGTLTSLSLSGSITSSAATCLTTSLTGTNSANLIYASMGDNDQFRILVGATASNQGYVEIATADDGSEPIYVRQYTGVFSSLARTATLLDGSGNTSFPGSVTAGGFVQTTSLTTGAAATAGTITGNWTLGSGSKLNATYADLAEKYTADADYEPGTVLVFGGEHEVTLSNDFDSIRVAGVVTTNPAYTMNNECEGEHVATIALQGRVPVKVLGPVYKGDLLVSAGNGYAIANNIARAGTIIGKSLQNFNDATGIIEVAVGRF